VVAEIALLLAPGKRSPGRCLATGPAHYRARPASQEDDFAARMALSLTILPPLSNKSTAIYSITCAVDLNEATITWLGGNMNPTQIVAAFLLTQIVALQPISDSPRRTLGSSSSISTLRFD
jgi:hypothetical protein